MAKEIAPYTSFEDALCQSPALVKALALERLQALSYEEAREDLERRTKDAVAAADEDLILILIQMYRQHLATHRAKVPEGAIRERFLSFLVRLFWLLPDCRMVPAPEVGSDAHRPISVLAKVKTLIFSELLSEWVAEAGEKSVFAFRRAIGMGWPIDKRYGQRSGETTFEMKVRGRFVGVAESKEYLRCMRVRLEAYEWGGSKRTVDEVFDPWLTQPLVPYEIRHLLLMARAKQGGEKLVERELKYAAILNGLPETGLEYIAGLTEGMRRLTEEAQEIPRIMAQRTNAGRVSWLHVKAPHLGITFIDTKTLRLNMTGGAETFDDACAAIETLRYNGALRCELSLEVHEGFSDKPPLVRAWPQS